MNRVFTIAREDARRAFRSRLVWGAIGLLAVMFLPSTGSSATPDVHPILEYLLLLPIELMTFSLVVVAAVGYSAVVDERVTGTLRFVLGLPATRRDLVLGKLLSRVGIAVTALGVILVIANVLVYRGYGSPYLFPFWVMGGWMLAYVVVWSLVTIGYSAAFDSPYRTLGALVVTHIVFSFNFGVWSVVIRPLFALLFTGSLNPPSYETLATAPLWLRVTERLNPLVDFWAAMRWSIESVGPGTPTGGPLPHVLGTLVFLSFGMLPFVLGIRRFERTDLGSEQSGFHTGDRLWRSLWSVRAAVGGSVSIPRAPRRSSRVWRLATADLRHTLQNWVVAGALVVTLLLAGPSLWSRIGTSSVFTNTEVLTRIHNPFTLPVVVLGIAVGHNAVVGERSSGTGRLLLAMPVTRRDLVRGKLLSRVGIVVATLLPLVLFAEALVVTRLGSPYPGALLAWAGWTLLYAITWTAVTVGFSAAVSSRYRSLAVISATFLSFGELWDSLVLPVVGFVVTGRFSVEEFAQAANPPMWFQYADHLSPFVALDTIREGLFEATGYGTQHTDLVVPLFSYSIVVLILFAGGIFVIGERRFDRSDLG
ncbi:ABC transporter permease [Halorussus sp. MSC15.2]|uniref:ABC transporter permease n=1 Tax=Halorussus sp. MSC15.2 TaxID=2283638 RepID=UPI0013CFB416|nr:ABC transporter permease subunit [Halorussus sp. MSC15.2]NEU57012.1 ABC transporter permease subunit [Halorussus sp. MSC15.2]